MSALARRDDLWTQYEGERVDKLIVRARRVNWRGRVVDNYVAITQEVEWVLIGDDYMGDFAVQVGFAGPLSMALELNDPLVLKMKDGWECGGRFSSLNERVLVMLCPVAAGNGIPPEQSPFTPAPPRQMGLGKYRDGWMR